MWYQRVVETTMGKMKPISPIEPEVFMQDTQLPAPRPQKRRWTEDGWLDDNPAQFRRVRLRYWGQIRPKSLSVVSAPYRSILSSGTLRVKCLRTQD